MERLETVDEIVECYCVASSSGKSSNCRVIARVRPPSDDGDVIDSILVMIGETASRMICSNRSCLSLKCT